MGYKLAMQSHAAKIKEFVAFVANHIQGDEKGEAQVFLDRVPATDLSGAYTASTSRCG